MSKTPSFELEFLLGQVALRRQQAQEEAEARQLGVEILKPGDRADLVMGNDGILRRGRHETVETDTADDDQDDDDKDSEEPIVKKPTLEEDRGIFLML